MADYGLLDIMPENLLEDKTISDITKSLDKVLKEINPKCEYPAIISRIDELDDEVLDNLAWQWKVDFYDTTLSVEKKRELIKKSIDWHRHKGTDYVVENVVATSIGSDAVIEDWTDYGGTHHCFRVKVEDASKIVTKGEELTKQIYKVKNARSLFEGFFQERDVDLNKYVGGVISIDHYVDIPLMQDPVIGDQECNKYIAGYVWWGNKFSV